MGTIYVSYGDYLEGTPTVNKPRFINPELTLICLVPGITSYEWLIANTFRRFFALAGLVCWWHALASKLGTIGDTTWLMLSMKASISWAMHGYDFDFASFPISLGWCALNLPASKRWKQGRCLAFIS